MLSKLTQRVVGAQRSTLIVIVGLAVYTLLVGAGASVVRAAIMGSLSVIALHYHRQNDALNALAASALLMTVHRCVELSRPQNEFARSLTDKRSLSPVESHSGSV
jgi:Competence protein